MLYEESIFEANNKVKYHIQSYLFYNTTILKLTFQLIDIISKSNTFSTIFGMRDHFLGVIFAI